jgi:dynein heavy chain
MYAGLMEEACETFDAYVRELSGLTQVVDREVRAKSSEMPTVRGKLSEYLWMEETREWIAWNELVPPYAYDPDLKFSKILVPTIDSEKTTWILKLMEKVWLIFSQDASFIRISARILNF